MTFTDALAEFIGKTFMAAPARRPTNEQMERLIRVASAKGATERDIPEPLRKEFGNRLNKIRAFSNL